MSPELLRQLIRKYLSGQATPEEKAQIQQWYLSFDDSHVQVPAEQTEEEQHLEATLLEKIHDKAVNIAHQEYTQTLITQQHAPTRRLVTKRFLRLAAAISLLLATTVVLVYLVLVFQAQPEPLHYQVQSVPNGKMSRMILSDSTVVWLNSASSLKYPKTFNQDRREVYLTGEAFFQVKRDEHKPFLVHTGRVETKVLGTSFNVKAYPESATVSVTVATGKVAVTDSLLPLGVLTPNQRLWYDSHSGTVRREAVNADQASAWREGQLVFADATFGEAAQTLERWFNVRVQFENQALKRCRVTASFDKGEGLPEVLHLLSLVHKTSYRMQGQHIILRGKGCNETIP